jgi:hypothetical protein
MNTQCILCPHQKVPDAYLTALRNARRPHDLNWSPAAPAGRFVYFDEAVLVEGDKIAPESLNLLRNPGLESWGKGPNVGPDGWAAGGIDPAFSRQESIVQGGSHAARLGTSGLRGVALLDQEFPAAQYAGKTVTFGAWMRSDILGMKDGGSVQILDFVNGIHEVVSAEQVLGDGQWHFVTVTKAIRQGASGNIRVRLAANIPYLPRGGVK